MKTKIVLLIATCILIASLSYALIVPPDSIALNASTYTAITIPLSNSGCRDVGVTTSDSTAWLLSYDEAGTKPVTIPAPGSLSIECVTDTSGVIFYAKASAGTPTMSVIIGVNK